MANKFKRFLSIALSVFMIMTMMPTSVLATEGDPIVVTETESVSSEEVATTSEEGTDEADVAEGEQTPAEGEATEGEQTSPESETTEDEQTSTESEATEDEQTPAEGETTEDEQTPAEGETTEGEQTPAEGETTEDEQTSAEGETTEDEQTPAEDEEAPVEETVYAAYIGETGYATLEEAIAAAEDYAEIELVAERIEVTETIVIDRSVSIYGAGTVLDANNCSPVFEIVNADENAEAMYVITGVDIYAEEVALAISGVEPTGEGAVYTVGLGDIEINAKEAIVVNTDGVEVIVQSGKIKADVAYVLNEKAVTLVHAATLSEGCEYITGYAESQYLDPEYVPAEEEVTGETTTEEVVGETTTEEAAGETATEEVAGETTTEEVTGETNEAAANTAVTLEEAVEAAAEDTVIDTVAELQAALNTGDVTLGENVHFNVPSGTMIDGNNNTLTINSVYSGSAYAAFYSDGSYTVKNLTVELTTSSNAIAFDMKNGGTLEGVTVNGGFLMGVNVGGGKVTVDNCTFNNSKDSNGAYGVYSDNSAGELTVKNSTFNGMRAALIYCAAEFTDNTVTGDKGVSIYTAASVSITGNTFTGDRALSISNAGEGTVITGNNISKDTCVEYAVSVDLSGNYWGGEAPSDTQIVADSEEVEATVDSYYTTVEEDGTLGGKELTTYVAKIGENTYATFAEAITAANAMTGDVTVEIYGEVEFVNGMELKGSYTSITFNKAADGAKITINQTAGGDYLEAHGKTVAFNNLILAKANPAWSGNSGHMGNYFSIQGGTVTYNSCTFPNGACTSGGTATYNNCTFENTSEYGLWVYDDADVTVNGGTIDSKKGIKVYSEDEASVTTTLTVQNATLTAKPAVAIGYAESITLIGNTYNNTMGVLELDSGSDADCEGVTFVAQDASGNDIASTLTAVDRSNSNAACGVLVDGKIYTTVTEAAKDATDGSTVTLLHNSTETVELPEGVTLDKNDYTAENVTEAQQPVVYIGDTGYKSLDAALAAAKEDGLTEVEITVTGDIKFSTAVKDFTKVTFTGTDRAQTIDMNLGSAIDVNTELVFKNLTVSRLDSDWLYHYTYIRGGLTYNNCKMIGLFNVTAQDTDFIGCDFYNDDTFGDGKYSLWLYNCAEGVEVNITNCTFDVYERAIKMYGDGYNGAMTLNISGTEFTSRTADKTVVEMAYDNTTGVGSMELNITNSTATGFGAPAHIEGETNAWFNVENTSTTAESVSIVKVNGEVVYTDVESGPAGTLNKAYISASYIAGVPAVYGEATEVVAKESFVVKLYSGETLVGTATLVDNDKVLLNGESKLITWHAALTNDGDSWWSTTWENGALNVNAIPDTAKLYVDGELVSTCNVELNIDNLNNPICAAVTDANGNVQSFVAGDGYLNSTLSYDAALQSAFTEGGNIVMLRDVTLTEMITIPTGTTVTLDLNGHDIEVGYQAGSTTKHIYAIDNLGTLTINGEGEINAHGIYNGYNNSDEVTTAVMTINSGVTINGIDVNGGYAIGNYATLTVNGGSINVKEDDPSDAAASGNLDATALGNFGTATLNGGEFTSTTNFTYAIANGGTLTVPANSTVEVTGAHGAVSQSGGTATISGGTFICTGVEGVSSGHVVYASNGAVTINGGTFTNNNTDSGSNGAAVCLEGDSASTTINGGTFTGCEAVIYGNANTVVNGGSYTLHWLDTYNTEDSLVEYVVTGKTVTVDGVEMTKTEDGLVEAPTEVDTFEELVAALAAGKDVVLTADITTTAALVTSGVTSTIDLNGKTLKIGAGDNKFNDASNITIKNGTIDITSVTVNGNAIFCLDEYEETLVTTLTLDNVNLTGNGYSSAYGIFYIGDSSVLNVNGGEWNLSNDTHASGGVFKADAAAATLNIDGTKMTLHNVRRVVTYADTTIKNSTIAITGDADGVDAEMEHGFNRSPLDIINSTITMKDMVGRGITAECGAVTISESSTVTITNAQEATIDVCAGKTVTVDSTSTVTVDAEPTITSGTITGTVNVNNPATADVAQIGEKSYDTLQAAINAAQTAGGEVTITLLSDVTENVTVNEAVGLYLTIDGADKTMTGTITVEALTDTNDNRRTTIKNIKFVDTDNAADVTFITSVKDNHYPRLTVQDCTFTGSGYEDNVDEDVAIRTKSAYDLIIKDCTGTGLHSFLQNTSGVKVTVRDVTVTDSNGGLAMGTAQNVTIRGCNITTNTYGIRLDAVLDTSVTLNGNVVNAYIPVSIRKATAAEYKLSFSGSASSYTATNADGVWCAICTTEYEEGVALNEPTGNVKIEWYTDVLDESKVYGAYEWPIEVVYGDGHTKGFDSLASAMSYGYSGSTEKTIIVHEDITESMDSLAGNITTDNPDGVTIKNTIVDAWIHCSEGFTIGEGVTYDATGAESGLFVYTDNGVINGTVLTDCYYQRYADSKLTINEPGSMTVTSETFIVRYMDGDADAGIYIVGDNNDETIGLTASVIYFYQGTINAKNADIKVGTYWQTNETDSEGSANLVLDNSNLTVTVNGHNMKATGTSTVTLTNGSSVSVAGGYEGVSVSMDETSTFTKNGVTVFAAKVGNVAYASLSDAINAAKADETVIMLRNVEEVVKIGEATAQAVMAAEAETVTDTVTLDLNGKTLTGSILAPNAMLTVKNGTIKNEDFDVSAIEINAGKLILTEVNIDSARHAVRIDGAVEAIINSGEYKVIIDELDKTQHAVNVSGAANVTINGGIFVGPKGTTADSGSAVNVKTDATVSITGGTFSGGKNDTLAAEGTLTVTGGTFDQDPTDYVAVEDGYVAGYDGENWVVGMMPNATVKNLQATTLNAGEYRIYSGSLVKGTEALDLQVVMQFIAQDDYEDAKANAFGSWNTDFYIAFNNTADQEIDLTGCYLVGNYGTFGWIAIPLEGVEIKGNTVYPVLGSMFSNWFTYADICKDVKDFKCGIYLTDAVLEAYPDLEVSLELRIAPQTIAAGETSTGHLTVGEYVYTVDDFIGYVATVTNAEGEVTKHTTLAEALNVAAAGDTVTLLKDAEISEPINVTCDLTIDGNGKTLTYTGQNRAITVESSAAGVDLTIKNLTVDCTASYCQRGINYNTNGKLTLDNVTVKGTSVTYAVNLPGSSDNATVEIKNSDITGHIALNIWGENMTVNVTDTDLTSVDTAEAENYSAIALNNDGTTSANGTVVNVVGGSITALDENDEPATAVRKATGTVNISDTTVVTGNITEPVAVVTYAGSTDSYSCYTLQSAIERAEESPIATVKLLKEVELTESIKIDGTVTFDLNGNKLIGPDDGEANWYAFIVDGGNLTMMDSVGTGELWAKCYGVETKSGSFTMESGKITATNNGTVGSAVVNYGGTVTIKGGTLSAALDVVHTGGYYADANTTINSVTIESGTLYVSDYSYTESVKSKTAYGAIVDGFKWVQGDDELYVLTAITYVAQIGEVQYETLAEAVKAAEAGATITLLANTDEEVAVGKALTIVLNGKTAANVKAAEDYTMTTDANGNLVFAASGLLPAEEYKFGRTVQLRFIEPWKLKINARVYIPGMSANENVDYSQLYDFGVYFVRKDDLNVSAENATVEDIINDSDTIKKSKLNGGASIDEAYGHYRMTATYDEDLYTYDFDNSVMAVFYVIPTINTEPTYATVWELNMLDRLEMYSTDSSYDSYQQNIMKAMLSLYDAVKAFEANRGTEL